MHQHDSLGALRCFAVFGLRLGCALHEFMLSAVGSCGSPSAEATLQSMQYAKIDPHAMSGTSALTSSLHIGIHVQSWRGGAQNANNGHITTTRVMGCLSEVVFFVVLSGYSCRVIVCQSQQTTSTEQDDSSLSTNVRVGILIGFLMAGDNCEERRVESCAPKGTRSCS